MIGFSQPTRVVPHEHRHDFFHLYGDIAWIGLPAGASLAFIAIYVTRLGATSWELGLLNAGPAVINLLITMLVGRWLSQRPIGQAVFQAAFFHRIGYVLWIILPFLLSDKAQIWGYILLILLMTVPGVALAVGFNALFAIAVPAPWRGHVVGIRNALVSAVLILTSLLCGWLLERYPGTFGYQLVFAVGFIGAMLSTLHLWFLRHITGEVRQEADHVESIIGDQARHGTMRITGFNIRGSVALRIFAAGRQILRLELLHGHYGWVMAALLAFHFTQYLPIPLFPLRWVGELHFSDQQISIGTAVFHGTVMIGSLVLDRIVRRLGNRNIMLIGVVGLSLYPFMTAMMTTTPFFLLTSFLGGAFWALVGGALGNFLLEHTPERDRPAYLAWYNIILNAGILLGSLGGPLLAGQIGLYNTLIVSGVARALTALAIWNVRTNDKGMTK